ncbi:TnpV protein [Ruminococcus sp.]|uniref:TnpV protein n=1 Tax=Ruminococcus sp. TaxID=41978 RepID=UPI00258AC13B|nr:TnpV protein [Ruminococcus sp.]MCR5021810.1 TnpV protein [Ruminococcus sp.]
MTYEKWKTLTEEEKQNVPDEDLPVIPVEQLRNSIVSARMVRMDGELGWESIQKVEDQENKMWFPEYKSQELEGQTIWYKFNPLNGTYSMNLSETEPTTEEEAIGIYGQKWMKWMEENYPERVTEMKFYHKYLTTARAVDSRAWEHKELLDRQYEKENPRPENFEEVLTWEQTRAFTVDSTVMRETVLVPVTRP